MKKAVIFLSIFFVTLMIGYFAVPELMKKAESPQIVTSVEKELPIIPIVEKPKVEENDEAEIFWEENIERKFKIELLETDQVFHDHEVTAKSGETWLGIFREGKNYFLRSAKIKIERVYDYIADQGKEQKTGKSVSVSNGKEPIFLLKNATKLKEGRIKTLIGRRYDEHPILMENGFSKDFEFNGEKYTLRVENKVTQQKFLTINSKLILSKGNTEQILASLKNDCDSCCWYLYWVGDLDRDGKLDSYIDLSNRSNVENKFLFLSSDAEKGELVKKVAQYWTDFSFQE